MEKSPLEVIRERGASCLVCAQPIPLRRARMRSTVCSDTCKEALRQFRLDILKTQKCPACNHPSTPEEWADYKRWRMERHGRLQPWAAKQGNPQHKAKALKLARAMQGLREALEGMKGDLSTADTVTDITAVMEPIFQAIDDSGFASLLQETPKPVDAEPEQ